MISRESSVLIRGHHFTWPLYRYWFVSMTCIPEVYGWVTQIIWHKLCIDWWSFLSVMCLFIFLVQVTVSEALSLIPPPMITAGNYSLEMFMLRGLFTNNRFWSGSLHVLATVPQAAVVGRDWRMTDDSEWKDCVSLWHSGCFLRRCTNVPGHKHASGKHMRA